MGTHYQLVAKDFDKTGDSVGRKFVRDENHSKAGSSYLHISRSGQGIQVQFK